MQQLRRDAGSLRQQDNTQPLYQLTLSLINRWLTSRPDINLKLSPSLQADDFTLTGNQGFDAALLNILDNAADASIATAVQAVKLGADDYLTKPVDLQQLEQALRGNSSATPPTAPDQGQPMLSPEQLEWEHIHRVLSEQDGNISRTAERLGMHRRTLQRKLAKHRP